MNLNEFAKEVHENAIAHGWWNEEYTDDAVVALIHAEISEAFEEWRAKRPMFYRLCDITCNGAEEVCDESCAHYDAGNCAELRRRPEPHGIAVELIDVVLRILDAAAAWGVAVRQWILYPADNPSNRLIAEATEKITVPELTCTLHRFAEDILRQRKYEEIQAEEFKESVIAYPLALTITWVRTHGINPEVLMREKHEYNKTRPYKHGGKRI